MANVAVLYRRSTMKQVKRKRDADEADYQTQRADVLRFLAGRPDWRLVKEYEEAESAFMTGALDRDVLQDAIRDAIAGKWSILLVWRYDRLSRRSLEYPLVLDQLRKIQVQVWDVKAGKQLALDNQMDKLIRFIEGWQAESESVSTSIRVSAHMWQMAEDGWWTGGPVPYGYMLVPRRDDQGEIVTRDGRILNDLKPDPEAAPIVRRVFERYMAGDGTPAIAQWLNGAVPSPTGKGWTHRTVRLILMNPLYMGAVRYGKRSRHQGEPILVPGRHEAIVDPEAFAQAEAIREGRQSLHPRQIGGRAYPLVGVLYCADCGSKIGGASQPYTTASGEKRWYNSYRCSVGIFKGVCRARTWSAKQVELAWLGALDYLSRPSELREFLESSGREEQRLRQDALGARQRAEKRLKIVREAVARLNRDFYEKRRRISGAEYDDLKTQYTQEMEQLEGELAAPLPGEMQKDYSALSQMAAALRVGWPGMTDERKQIVALDFCRSWGIVVKLSLDRELEFVRANVEKGRLAL